MLWRRKYKYVEVRTTDQEERKNEGAKNMVSILAYIQGKTVEIKKNMPTLYSAGCGGWLHLKCNTINPTSQLTFKLWIRMRIRKS